MPNETSQIPVTDPGTCLVLVSIRPGQGNRPDESEASHSHANRVTFPPNFDLFFDSVGLWTAWSSDSVVGLSRTTQGSSLNTSKHHSSVSSPSVPEHLAHLLSVAHVDLSRTKMPSAVLKTGSSCLIWARALSSLRRSQPRTNGQIS